MSGRIVLPKSFKEKKLYRSRVYWPNLRNAVRPIRAPLVHPARKMVIAIEGSGLSTKLTIPPTIRMADARFTPPVLPVRPGASVEFANDDWRLHLLEPFGKDKFMAPQSIGPGDAIKHTFAKRGTYHIRCTEVPHMVATVLVTDKAQVALPDNTGAFQFANIPKGTYALRVWYHGKWIHEQPVTVRGRTTVDVQLKKKALGKD